MAITALVHSPYEPDANNSVHDLSGGSHIVSTPRAGEDPPAGRPTGTDSGQSLAASLQTQGLTHEVCGTMMAGWSCSSEKQYQVYFNKWIQFSQTQGFPHNSPSLPLGLAFLQHLLGSGTKYSSLNTACSMLSAFVILPGGQTFGKHPHVSRFMRGVSKLCPALPKYDDTWDPTVVIHLLTSWRKIDGLSLELLTKRTLVLFFLVTGQRVQTAHVLKCKDIVFTDDVCSVAVSGDVKQTKRHVRKQVFTFKLFPTKELCLHTHLRQYISLTQTPEEFLFLTFGGRRRRATKDTLARYVKSVLTAFCTSQCTVSLQLRSH